MVWRQKMNIIIVHGSNSTEKGAKTGRPENQRHWKPWIKKQLESKGIEVSNELYPQDWLPNYKKWKEVFDKNNINEETTLIGHSSGCAFLVRWLGESKQKISKLILVAPWKIPDGNDELIKEFYNYPIENKIKERVNKVIIFTSNDEEEDGKRSAKMFSEALNGEIIELKNHGHFTLGDMGTDKFPELLKEVLEK
jgi:predicted alpha/beta hydrolase family esterase